MTDTATFPLRRVLVGISTHELDAIAACVEVSHDDDNETWSLADSTVTRMRREMVDATERLALEPRATEGHDRLRAGLASAATVEIAEKIVEHARNPFLVTGLARLLDVVSRTDAAPDVQLPRIEMVLEILNDHLPTAYEPTFRVSDLTRLRKWLETASA